MLGNFGTRRTSKEIMFWVYVLKSLKNGKYYIGQTNNLTKRLKEHNRGKDHSSKIGLPWIFVASKIFETRKEAMRTEKIIKNLKSKARLNIYIAGWSSG